MRHLKTPTTKAEWKAQYAAARLLIKARRIDRNWWGDSKAQNIVWRIAYRLIHDQFHRSIAYAVFGNGSTIYPITKSKWAIKENSKVFNRKVVRRSKSCNTKS